MMTTKVKRKTLLAGRKFQACLNPNSNAVSYRVIAQPLFQQIHLLTCGQVIITSDINWTVLMVTPKKFATNVREMITTPGHQRVQKVKGKREEDVREDLGTGGFKMRERMNPQRKKVEVRKCAE